MSVVKFMQTSIMEHQTRIEPMDAFNKQLVQNVHPPEWVNPTPNGRYNLVVVGAGVAGLVTAAIAAGLGARVALIEKHLLGGDCLNFGCVPSKALISASRVASEARNGVGFGIHTAPNSDVRFSEVMERMRQLRAQISPNDSAARFRALGVDVYFGGARFLDGSSIEVAGTVMKFKKAVIATGARSSRPPIAGLEETGYHTNETIFSLTERPARLAVIGGGPIGCELAQAFQRLGSKVTILEGLTRLMPREDPEAAGIVTRSLQEDGVQIRLGAKATRVERGPTGTTIHFDENLSPRSVIVDEILVGVGRAPNVNDMGLEAAGVRFDVNTGVEVNDQLQTSNPNIYAAGDVCLPFKFTHTADFAARIVVQNALFPFLPKKKFSDLVIPWCTYTDPEVAHVGASEHELTEAGATFDTITVPMSEVDRAILESNDEGFLKVHVDKRGKILGGTLVARHAGDMISELTLAIVAGIRIGTIGSTMHPYPTEAEILRKAADAYNRKRLTPGRKRILASIMSALR